MTEDNFVSFAQNGEDVVLWRALHDVEAGRYVDVGANHPTIDSVSRAFYNHGWSGLLVEPNEEFASQLREGRPRDTVEQVVASETTGKIVLHSVPGTGLSSIVDIIGERHGRAGRDVVDLTVESVPLSELLHRNGFDEQPIHFMTIDTEGAELSVLRSVDLQRYRPWILVIEATSPTTTTQVHQEWEPLVLEAGYRFCLFDGLSRFYVADEQAERLESILGYPAGVFDVFETAEARRIREEADGLRASIASLEQTNDRLEADAALLADEAKAFTRTIEGLERELGQERSWRVALADEAIALRRTLSWRVTAPLRAVRRVTIRRGPIGSRAGR